jgi:hypothetical protein
MTSLLILAAIAGVTIFLAFFWRVNSMLLFTSVAVGDLLVRYMGNNANLVINSFYRGANADVIAKLGLLLLPVIFTLIFGRKSLSHTKAMLHFAPIVATGIVLALLVLTLLPTAFQDSVYNSQVGPQIKQNQDLSIAAAGVISLLVAWITNEGEKKRHSKKHK